MIGDLYFHLRDIRCDGGQIDHRRFDCHHGQRHYCLKDGLNANSVAVLDFNGLDCPVVGDDLPRQEGLHFIGLPGQQQMRAVICGVLFGGYFDVVVGFGDVPHEESPICVREPGGDLRPRGRIANHHSSSR